MSIPFLLAISAGLASIAMALWVLWYDRRAFLHRLFAGGMILLALEAFFFALGHEAEFSTDMIRWYRVRLVPASLIPGIWLLFSLSYGRTNYREFILRWKWLLFAFFFVPVFLVSSFWPALFVGTALDEHFRVLFRMGWAGFALHLTNLFAAILVLINLERTLRHATGHQRWQVKFMVLGVGCVFGARIYTESQGILYRIFDPSLEAAPLAALLLGSLLMARTLRRTPLLNFGFYLSHSFLYNSLTVLFVGLYLIAVGVLARLLYIFKGGVSQSLVVFLVLLAMLGVAVFLLSDRFRLYRKRFVSRHFHRPRYDYLKVWSKFTAQTASVTDLRILCERIVKEIAQTMETLSVNLWLMDEQGGRLSFGGSTSFSEEAGERLEILSDGGQALIETLKEQKDLLDISIPGAQAVEDFKTRHRSALRQAKIDLLIPLRAAGRMVGVLAIGDKVSNEPYTFEDRELLKTLADQAAANLLTLKLGERIQQAREAEAFQVMSAFFMHDLKNVASRLSLLTQNLPVHFNNPEFRKDALKAISQSLERINRMCGRLSILSQGLEILPKEVDLNRLVTEILQGMNGLLKTEPMLQLGELPRIRLDPEQIQKVLTNLLFNANDAIGETGSIRVKTEALGNAVSISVIDDGCGMSREFMQRSLFHAFRTTKKQGTGIGLFHSRKIVEAHGGRIEVESEEGKGSTFRVVLPLRSKENETENRG